MDQVVVSVVQKYLWTTIVVDNARYKYLLAIAHVTNF